MPQFPQAESPGDGGSGPALPATKAPWGLGSRKRPAIDKVPGVPSGPGPEPRHKVKTRTRTRGLRARSRAEAARKGRRQRTSGPGRRASRGPGEPTGPARRRVREGRDETAPRSTHRAPLRSPAASCPARAPLRVFLRPHFRRSAPSHCARLEAGGAPPRAPPRAGSAHRKRAPPRFRPVAGARGGCGPKGPGGSLLAVSAAERSRTPLRFLCGFRGD